MRQGRTWGLGVLLAAVLACAWGAPAVRAADTGVKAWPLVYYATDPLTQETRTELLWPFYVRESGAHSTATRILSIPWESPDDYASQYYLFWPLSGLRLDERHGADAWFFPVLWYRTNHHLACFPAFYWSPGPDSRKAFNFLLLQHNSWKADGSRFHALWPLFFYDRDVPAKSLTTVLFPAFWHENGPHGSFNQAILATWSRSDWGEGKDRETGAHHAFWPLYAQGWRQGPHTSGSWLWAMPWYQSDWTYRTAPPAPAKPVETGEATRILFPFYWDWRDRGPDGESRTTCLFPIGLAGRDCRGEREWNLLGPLYNRYHAPGEANRTRTDILWPIGKFESTLDSDGKPLARNQRLFPFYWHRQDAYTIFFPLTFYFGSEMGNTPDEVLNVAGLYHSRWNDREQARYLIPLAGMKRSNAHGLEHAGILPFWWYWRGDNGEVLQGSLLATWSRTETPSDSWHAALWPFFFEGSSASGANLTRRHWVFPVYHADTRSAEVTRSGAPARETATTIVSPLWWSRQTVATGNAANAKPAVTDLTRVLFPVWWEFADAQSRSLTLVPLGNRTTGRDGANLNVLGPIFNRYTADAGTTVRTDVLFPLVKTETAPGRTGGRIVPLLSFWETQDHQKDSLAWLFPLGWNEEEESPRPGLTQAFYPFYWHTRAPRRETYGFFPLGWREWHRNAPWNSASELYLIPLLARLENGDKEYRQDWLLSILAWGRGEDWRLFRLWPLFSEYRDSREHSTWSWLLPFSREATRTDSAAGVTRQRKLNVPFSFLPIYGSRATRGPAGDTDKSWVFPFYGRQRDTAAQTSSFSVLWPLYSAEWTRHEVKIQGIGGVSNYYERDAAGFAERRVFYRVWRSRERSWFAEKELTLFFNSSRFEDGASSWNLLGGLFGAGRDERGSYLRLLFIPIRTGGTAPAEAAAAARQTAAARHADLALKYLAAGRNDRATLELDLAGNARENDAAWQLAAGRAYLRAQPEALRADFESGLAASSSLYQVAMAKGGYNTKALADEFRTRARRHLERAQTLGADRRTVRRELAFAHTPDDPAKLREVEANYAEYKDVVSALDLGAARLEEWRWKLDERRRHPAAVPVSQDSPPPLLADLVQAFPDSLLLQVMELNHLLTVTQVVNRTPVELAEKNAECRAMLSRIENVLRLSLAPAERDWLTENAGLSRNGAISLSSLTAWGKCPDPAVAERLLHADAADKGMEAIAGLLSREESPSAQVVRADVAMRRPPVPRENLSLDLARELEPRLLRLAKANPDSWHLRRVVSLLADIYVRNRSPSELLHLDAALTGTAATREYPFGSLKLSGKNFSLADALCPATRLNLWRLRYDPDPVDSQQPVRSQEFDDVKADYVDLNKVFGNPAAAGHVTAACMITAEQPANAVLHLGFDEELTVTWNGQTVFGPRRGRVALADEFTVPVRLQSGDNRLVLTLRNAKLGFGFFARLTTPEGRPLPVRISAGQ